jgi:hypothetical protein
MRRVGFVIAGCVVASCHLADSPEPPKCPPGSHPELGHCTVDPVDASSTVKISAAPGGTSCDGDAADQRPPGLSPDPLTVALGVAFTFQNDDVVDHEIKGADGQLWTTVKAGATADPAVKLAKTGSWAYRVSGCAKGGTIVVE